MENKRFALNDLFLACMCKRFLEIPNTKILLLLGNELSSRIRRRIDDADVELICRFLTGNPRVVSVNLAYNQISDYGLSKFVEFLDENSSVLEVNLMNNKISESGVVKLAATNNTHLKSLRVNGNKIGNRGLKSLALMLSSNQTLMNLDVGETDLTIDSFVHFTSVLRTSNSSLQALTLNRVLGPPGHALQTDQIALNLQQALTVNKTLVELHLQNIVFLDHDVEILVEGLKKNDTLLLLDLACNNIGDFGMERIAEFLGTKPPLRTLIMNNNNVRDPGARSLSFNFPSSNITFLDISRNKLTDDGLLDVLNCLKKERPVQGLFLRGNQIGEKTCRVLFRMILSGVLFDNTLDVNVYREKGKFVFTCTESVDHIMPHYYCLCASTERNYCRNCTLMEIRNKEMD